VKSVDTAEAALGARIQPSKRAGEVTLARDASEPAFPVAVTLQILVVSEHRVGRLLLTRQLSTLGHAVIEAEHGAEGLMRWVEGGVQAIFTDCEMSVMDGYALARAVRAHEEVSGLGRVPIFAVAPQDDGRVEGACREAGIDELVTYPVLLEKLRERLDRCFPRSAANGGEPIDRDVLQCFSAGDRQVERDLLAQFATHYRADTAAIDQALAAHDSAELAQAAHRLRGPAGLIGARATARACERLELAARSGQWLAIDAAMTEFDRERRRLAPCLAENA